MRCSCLYALLEKVAKSERNAVPCRSLLIHHTLFHGRNNSLCNIYSFTELSVSSFACFSGGAVTSCQRRYRKAPFQLSQNLFIPRCKLDGRYEEVQCQSTSGKCWCVDQNGKEIPKTRSSELIKCPVEGSWRL